eukprot:TRINITY_DN14746_c0_g1_i1.p1 TRINITY_DN14746_c0_g1~~TRINITY_DN14746_c0_g1_i1.p1  ORF type:complete len:1132 (+),score=491.47 TRINITY_DN14746_c0_g1_i1:52-3396(+)
MAAALLLCAALSLGARREKVKVSTDAFWVNPNLKGTPQPKPTITPWASRPRKERGPAPYVPPSDWVYNTTGGPVEGKINVHLVPHSHDDTGWQVTVDQYFYEQVYYILDTLLVRLNEDPNRRFMFVETAFFARWWDQQPASKQALMKTLVERGQLEFINGGWCMHDEASPYYVEMVDQTTRGHQFLKKQFGRVAAPKGTWSIDPFGHSNTNAWLLGAEAGMEFEFWGRMDYQDFNMRVDSKGLEWVWQGSQSLGDSAQIFAGQLFGGGHGGYGTWFGFDGSSPQVQDDPSRHDYNVDQLVDQFIQHAQQQAKSYQTEHQMWACGDDFNYQNADHWYHNLDKLIHYVNKNGTVNAFYSTPSIYVDQKKKANLTWEVRQDDIFPLGDADHHYWSGYFTSRPSLKRQVHMASNFLNAARQLEVISGVTAEQVNAPTERPSPPVGPSWTDSLEGTVGVATHHDGMSGTERQDVSDDYEQRISESHGEVEAGVALSLNRLLGTNVTFEHCNCNSMGADNCLNISMCGITTEQSAFTVVAWNPLGRASAQTVRLPVTGGDGWNVSVNGRAVVCQTTAIDSRTLELPQLYLNYYNMTDQQAAAARAALSNKATHILVFDVTIPALGYSTVSVSRTAVQQKSQRAVEKKVRKGDPVTISNSAYELTFDGTTGMTATLKNLASGASTPFVVSMGWYNSSVGGCTHDATTDPQHECDGQKSGAYIFRSNTSQVFYPGPATTPTLQVSKGPVVQEVQQVFSPWATAVYRLYQGHASVEVEWTVGPIPTDTPWMPSVVSGKANEWGKEVVVKYSTGMATEGVFYTDSNGREMVRRQFNKRGPSYPPLVVNEPVAGNYYPVNAMISVQDAQHELAVLTDASMGGASLKDGEVELMVHRRILDDDSRGVQEPLNETMCGCNDINAGEAQMGEHGHEGDGGCWCEGLTMRGRHLLMFDTIEQVNQQRRQAMEELSFPATLAFSKGLLSPQNPTASFLAQELPAGLKLLTLTSNYAGINDGKLLLRVAHLYGAGESSAMSVPINVNFTAVFAKQGLTVTSMDETQLTGTYSLSEMDAKKHKWQTFDPTGGAVLKQLHETKAFNKRYPFDVTDFTVTVRPMEVRTFLVTFQ